MATSGTAAATGLTDTANAAAAAAAAATATTSTAAVPTRRKNPSALEVARANLRQLEIEVTIPKIKVSQAAQDLQNYIEEHQSEDYLVRGFESSPEKNPFRKKKFNTCKLF